MTSERQIAANRINGIKSHGPTSLDGKLRSRRNALKHGLTAVTVVDVFEDRADYDAFEQVLLADYLPTTFVEREFVQRLASLLWRLRRAIAVETGLMQIHGEIQRNIDLPSASNGVAATDSSGLAQPLLQPISLDQSPIDGVSSNRAEAKPADLARCFLRMANYDRGLFERIGKYERALWRQVRQLIALLDAVRREPAIR